MSIMLSTNLSLFSELYVAYREPNSSFRLGSGWRGGKQGEYVMTLPFTSLYGLQGVPSLLEGELGPVKYEQVLEERLA